MVSSLVSPFGYRTFPNWCRQYRTIVAATVAVAATTKRLKRNKIVHLTECNDEATSTEKQQRKPYNFFVCDIVSQHRAGSLSTVLRRVYFFFLLGFVSVPMCNHFLTLFFHRHPPSSINSHFRLSIAICTIVVYIPFDSISLYDHCLQCT